MPQPSPFSPVHIPEVDLYTFLCGHSPVPFPETNELYVDAETKRALTYAQVREDAAKFGKALKSSWGWKKGDVIGMFSSNNIEMPVVIFGAHWAGGVVSPANPTYTADELALQLRDSSSKALITQKGFLDVALKAASKAGIPEDRVILLGDERDTSGRFKHWTEIPDSSVLFSPKQTVVDPKKDLAFIVYSSGTTGLPKGVMLTHYNIVANICQLQRFDIKTFDPRVDSQLGVLPFYHIYGLVVVLMVGTYIGMRTVVMAKFHLEKACQAIQDHQITIIYVPPPIVLLLAKHPVIDTFDLTSVRFINSGAAPLTKELVDGVWNRLQIVVKQAYGMSEASPATHSQMADEFTKFVGSIGRLLPNMEAKIVDEDGKEVPDGEVGELLLKGPNVFSGYLNRPDLDKDTFCEEGFYRTGDIAYRNAKGHYYITDRLKELIKYNGFQVPPAELEGILLGRDDIADVCVIGVWDTERQTEIPRAYIVLKPSVEGNEKLGNEIEEWLSGRVAPHKRLRGGVRFIDAIPKSAAGKILRRVLKEEVKNESQIKAKL